MIPTERLHNLNPSNLEHHHLCCALSGQKHLEGVTLKKALLREGFRSGLIVRKLDVRAKVFVEFAPAEGAWKPIEAADCLVIHCLWVSGRYQGRGLGRQLWKYCHTQAESYQGIATVSGKGPYLTQTDFYLHHGFEILDQSHSGFQLVGFPKQDWEIRPKFTARAREERVPQTQGIHFEYTHQCASPFGTFGAYLHGRLITHELMSPNKFRRLLTAFQDAPG